MLEDLLAGGFRDLIECRREIPSTMTAEDIREAVLARAKEMGFTIHALVPEEYRAGFSNHPRTMPPLL